MATLYEIKQDILDCIDMETGEIIDPDKLAQLQLDKHDKLHNIGLLYLNMRADMEQYKAEKERFAAKEKACKRTMEWAKETLARELNGMKMKETEFSVSYRTSDPLEIEEGASIPTEYLIPQEPRIDREGLRKALRAGAVIEGCKLGNKLNIQIK